MTATYSDDVAGALRGYDEETLGAIVDRVKIQLTAPEPSWVAEPVTLRAIHATGLAELHRRALAEHGTYLGCATSGHTLRACLPCLGR